MIKKLALVFGGEPRFIEKGFNENKIFLQWLKDNYDVDVHVHCWNHRRIWSSDDHATKRFQGRMEGNTYYPSDGTSRVERSLLEDDVRREFDVYQPKTFVMEKYNDSLYTIDGGFPTGQYVSRSKAYKQAVEYAEYDYVWITRTDLVYDADQPATFTFLEEYNNQILTEGIRMRNGKTFTAEDWFFAGNTNLFTNLIEFADDPLRQITDPQFGGEWFINLRAENEVRNSHIWQALITGGSGEGTFTHDSRVNWKLLCDD